MEGDRGSQIDGDGEAGNQEAQTEVAVARNDVRDRVAKVDSGCHRRRDRIVKPLLTLSRVIMRRVVAAAVSVLIKSVRSSG